MFRYPLLVDQGVQPSKRCSNAFMLMEWYILHIEWDKLQRQLAISCIDSVEARQNGNFRILA